MALEVHRPFGSPGMIVELLNNEGFDVMATDSNRNVVEAVDADYIYASRTGALRHPPGTASTETARTVSTQG